MGKADDAKVVQEALISFFHKEFNPNTSASE
jgi:hypothetical protein